MKGNHMMERLKTLEKSEGPMNQFISKQRDKQHILKKLSRDEQNKLVDAVDTVACLKTKVKKEMALIKVIDLTKKGQEEQKGDS